MEPAPDIVTITEFRRDAAGIIGGAVASGAPVFVTQQGRVTAVVLSRDRYEGLLHRAALAELRTAGAADPLPAADAAARQASASVETPIGRADTPFRLVETRFGLVDPATADFLEVEGFGVETRTRASVQCDAEEGSARD